MPLKLAGNCSDHNVGCISALVSVARQEMNYESFRTDMYSMECMPIQNKTVALVHCVIMDHMCV